MLISCGKIEIKFTQNNFFQQYSLTGWIFAPAKTLNGTFFGLSVFFLGGGGLDAPPPSKHFGLFWWEKNIKFFSPPPQNKTSQVLICSV